MVSTNTFVGKHWHLGYCERVGPCLGSTEGTQHRRRLGERATELTYSKPASVSCLIWASNSS